MKKCVYAIGDIHGRLDLLLKLRENIREHSERFDDKTCIYLGDYIDRGPDSCGVVETLSTQPMDGFTEKHIKGNHEIFMIGAMSGKARPNWLVSWLFHGGLHAVVSYKGFRRELLPSQIEITLQYNHIHETSGGKKPRKITEEDCLLVAEELRRVVPQHQQDFFANLVSYHQIDDLFFVHAGIDPHKPLNQQTDEEFCWIREGFVDTPFNIGLTVVHGHTPSQEVVIHPWRIGCDTGAYGSGILSAVAIHDDGVDVITSHP